MAKVIPMRAIYIPNDMVTKPTTEFDDNPFDFSAKGHLCFYCGQFLTDPAVVWSGHLEEGKNLFLHAECVWKWVPALARDALEIKYAGHPCWNQLAREAKLEP